MQSPSVAIGCVYMLCVCILQIHFTSKQAHSHSLHSFQCNPFYNVSVTAFDNRNLLEYLLQTTRAPRTHAQAHAFTHFLHQKTHANIIISYCSPFSNESVTRKLLILFVVHWWMNEEFLMSLSLETFKTSIRNEE